MNLDQMRAIAGSENTISSKIRALDKAGFARADIARFLDRRYQHIRNVLEGDKRRSAGGPAELPKSSNKVDTLPRRSNANAVFRLRVNDEGALVLPRFALESFGVAPGETIVGSLEGDQLVLVSAETAMTHAQELVQALVPGSDSLADSLIADRRREAERDRDRG